MFCSEEDSFGSFVLKGKPLISLQELENKFPPVLSFHLRELYLRKNLDFTHMGNEAVFKQINDKGLHQYLTFLMNNKVKAEVISVYF